MKNLTMIKFSFTLISLVVIVGGVQGHEFKCLEGARDSGPYVPGNIVRWCEIQKGNRLLYHGSVWRWYKSGKPSSKGFYINGNAEGEWQSWFENGETQTQGIFNDGEKVGTWKYWNQGGWLNTEVKYSSKGNGWSIYYPNSNKKATGISVPGGKVGLWTYWDSEGSEVANCDFGDGLFTLPSRDCELIAFEIGPKGFSRPIPKATTNLGNTTIKIASQNYDLKTPPGWIADVVSGSNENLPVVLYPKNGAWKGAGANIYIRVLFKDGNPFNRIVAQEIESFEGQVAELTMVSSREVELPLGNQSIWKTVNYKPLVQTDSPFSIVSSNTVFETIGYLDASDQVVIMVVLTSPDEESLTLSTSALDSLVASFRPR
jgi:hypothetical protein